MSLRLETKMAALESRADAQDAEIKELRRLLEALSEPELNVIVPAFPKILRKMGYKPPDDGSPEAHHA